MRSLIRVAPEITQCLSCVGSPTQPDLARAGSVHDCHPHDLAVFAWAPVARLLSSHLAIGTLPPLPHRAAHASSRLPALSQTTGLPMARAGSFKPVAQNHLAVPGGPPVAGRLHLYPTRHRLPGLRPAGAENGGRLPRAGAAPRFPLVREGRAHHPHQNDLGLPAGSRVAGHLRPAAEGARLSPLRRQSAQTAGGLSGVSAPARFPLAGAGSPQQCYEDSVAMLPGTSLESHVRHDSTRHRLPGVRS
jgi:hypothetical protein